MTMRKLWKCFVAAGIFALSAVGTVFAEDSCSICRPSEAEISTYKTEGTWEQRQEYMERLGNGSVDPRLIQAALARENGIDFFSAGDDIPTDWKGMPVTGNAKILAVRVEFQDIKFEDSPIYKEGELEKIINGNGNSSYPYENLHDYYNRSSYGTLNISTDGEYSYTLSKNRDDYFASFDMSPEIELVKEVLLGLDKTIDYSQYDGNKDGCIDAICINFAGEAGDHGTTWWSHEYAIPSADLGDFSVDGMQIRNYVFLATETDDTYKTKVLIHETGHLLGLPDYYSKNPPNDFRTDDMMNNNTGDHNGLSKWLLGWLPDSNIQKINKQSGDTTVNLAPLSSENLTDKPMIAVIAPEDTSIHSEYFLVQYDRAMNNQAGVTEKDNTYAIYHINAQLNENGTNFLYNNYNCVSKDRHFIKSVQKYDTGEYEPDSYLFKPGNSLTPDTNESSAFYAGSVMGYTGINITDFQVGDSPSFKVSFEEKPEINGDINLEPEIAGGTLGSRAFMKLHSGIPLYKTESDETIYLEKDGKYFPLMMYLPDSQTIELRYTDGSKPLEANTEYTLVVPANIFQIDADVFNTEQRISVKTSNFPATEHIYSASIPDPYLAMSAVVQSGTDTAVVAQYNGFLTQGWSINLWSPQGVDSLAAKEVILPFPQGMDNTSNEFSNIAAVSLNDGTIAVAITADNHTVLYKLSENGEVLSEPVDVPVPLDIFSCGNSVKGTVQQMSAGRTMTSPLSIYTIDFQNEPRCTDLAVGYTPHVFSTDRTSYTVTYYNSETYAPTVEFWNEQDELTASVTLDRDSPTGIPITVLPSGNEYQILYFKIPDNPGMYGSLFRAYFNADGEFLKEDELIKTVEFPDSQSMYDMPSWKLDKADWGYTLHYDNKWTNRTAYFLNENMQLISSLQIPSNAEGTCINHRFITRMTDETSLYLLESEFIGTKADPETPPKPDPENPPKQETQTPGSQSLKKPGIDTGDQTTVFLYILALTGALMIFFRKRKKQ